MRKYLYLYLTIACFLALIAIFVFDGYMGVYDRISVTAGEYEREIKPDFWVQSDQFWSTGANWGEKVFFSYQIDNNRLSVYADNVNVSVWHGQEKVADLVSQPVDIPAFDQQKMEWVVDTGELFPEDIPVDQGYQYTVMIKRGGVERRVIVNLNPSNYPPKPTLSR